MIKYLTDRKAKGLTILLGLLVCLAWGNSLIIYSKAYAAKFLIAQAWEATLKDGAIHRPWPWADTWPVGKLYFPHARKTLFILSGSHGSALAFGPGHVDGTALPSEEGTMVVGGHRDTHFGLLNTLDRGDIFLLQGENGHWQYFRLERTHVTDTRDGPWYIQQDKKEVHLITCYPFDAVVPGGPQRFVAVATPLFRQQDTQQGNPTHQIPQTAFPESASLIAHNTDTIRF